MTWGVGRGPSFDFTRISGESLEASGHRSVWQKASPGDCGEVHAQETVTVTFDNAYWLIACAAEPGLAVFEQQVRAMVASTRFLPA